MLRTLHGYLTRDLVKVTLLSLLAITLLMTVLAIVQPLRKMGLAGEQVLRLFGYTLPIMLSFTLPVATLFAATLVYGRFSQDNELVASRASGVATVALLRPALAIGALVTVLSLVLSNFIAPNMTTMAGLAQANVRGIIYHRLKTCGYIDVGRLGRKHIIHADSIDEKNDTLEGVMYAYIRKPKPAKAPGGKPRPGGVFLASASAAYLDFLHDDDQARVVIRPQDPSVIRVGQTVSPPIAPQARSMQIVMPIENPINEKPSWYSWHQLLDRLKEPSRHGEIGRRLEQVKQLICRDMLAQAVVDAVAAGKPYTALRQGDEQYEIDAGAARKDDDGAAILTAADAAGRPRKPVTVTVRRRGEIVQTITASSGRAAIAFSPVTRRPQVSLELTGDVTVEFVGPGPRRTHRPDEWTRGEMPVPAEIRSRAEKVRLLDVFNRPAELTTDPKILKTITALRTRRIPRLRSALIAELHARIAYGLSCFLMVAMGAALGLIFRGGQFISAFAISAVPAAIVIAMLLMGKGMVNNPDVEASVGLACIWGGIVALVVANVLLYWHLARR